MSNIGLALQYVPDFLRISRGCNDLLRHASENSPVNDFLLNTRFYTRPLAGLTGLMAYDMTGENKKAGRRYDAGKASALSCCLVCLVDDVIDTGVIPPEDRWTFVERVRSTMFGYSSHHEGGIMEQSSYALARLLYRDFFQHYGHERLEEVADRLIDAVKRQTRSADPQELVELEKAAGGLSVSMLAVLAELASDSDHPDVVMAFREMGAYGQMLDDLADVDQDVGEGTNTYATFRIRAEGDSEHLRGELHDVYVSHAIESLRRGISHIRSDEQLGVYGLVKLLIDAKYRRRIKQLPTLEQYTFSGAILQPRRFSFLKPL